MDILQNKKALAGIGAGVVIVLVVMFFVMNMMGSGGGDEEEDQTATTPAAATDASGATASSGASSGAYPGAPPGAYPGASATATVDASGAPAPAPASTDKALPPAEKSLADPFTPINPSAKVNAKKLALLQTERTVASLPPLTIYNPRPTADTENMSTVLSENPASAANQPDTSQRRVAGIVVGKNAYAILEVDGQTAVVKPGDVLPDFTRVERIERDRVLLRKGAQAIFVPLASNPSGATGGPVTGGGTYGGRPGGNPGSYNGGRAPGGGYGGRRGG